MKRVLKEVDGSGWLDALVFGGRCIFTFGHDMQVGGGGSLHCLKCL